jgi:hypothetical protein
VDATEDHDLVAGPYWTYCSLICLHYIRNLNRRHRSETWPNVNISDLEK